MTKNNESDQQEEKGGSSPEADPVRKWTIRILVLCLVLLAGYLTADRLTPASSQARVHSLVVPIAAQVSGRVTEVAVDNNQLVQAGDALFRIEDDTYRLAVASAEANLQSARQATGASAAGVSAAEAGVASAQAALVRAEQDTIRLRRIKSQDAGAISDRILEASEASLIVAQQQLAGAKANLELLRSSSSRGRKRISSKRGRTTAVLAKITPGFNKRGRRSSGHSSICSARLLLLLRPA